MKHNLLNKSWRFFLATLMLLSTFGVNVAFGALTAHEPGVYEKAAVSGGYGIDLTTVGTDKYEVYYFSANSKYGAITTGVAVDKTKTNYRLMAADANSEHILLASTGNATGWHETCDWIDAYFPTTGFAKSDYTYTIGDTYGEFFSTTINGGTSGYTKTCFIKPYNQDVITIKVKGYTEFAMLAKDNSTSKYLTVTVDDADPVSWKSATLSRRSVALTTAEHTIVIACVGGSANNIYGFSLKVPAADPYTVTFDANGGTCGTSSLTEASAGVGVTLPGATPADEATQELLGWAVSSTETDPAKIFAVGAKYEPSADVTLYAIYGAKTVKSAIVYANTKGATNSNPTLYTEGVGVPSFANLDDVDGWHFTGWNPSSISASATGEQTITAEWTKAPRTMFSIVMKDGISKSLAKGGGEQALDATYATVTGGAALVKNIDASNDGKMQLTNNGIYFNGGNAYLYIALDEELHEGDVITFTSNSTNQICFTLDDTRETSLTTADKSYTIPAESPLIGAAELYVWRTSSSGTNVKTLTIKTIEDYVAPVYHSVTFDMQGATSAAIEAQSVKNGKKAVKPEDPTKTGFDFVKWVVASTEADYDFDAAVTADVALKAVWTPQVTKYTVTYAKGDEAVTGDVPTQESLAAGANFTVAGKGDLAWTDHKFVGWKDQDDAAVAAGAEYTMPAKDVTLTAQWNVVTTYDVTFNLQGHGAAIEAQRVIEGETATRPADPKAELYTFGGWYTEAECTNAFDFATTITAAKELFAKWTAFGEATSFNFEQFVIDNTKKGDIKAALTAANYDYVLASGDALDSLVASGKDYMNAAFLGLKLKTAGSYVVANIPGGKLVDVVLGNLGGAKVQINGADAKALAAGKGVTPATNVPADYTASHNYYYSETAAVLKVLSGTSTTVLKAINFLDPFVVTFANGGEIDPKTFKGTAITLPAATGVGEFQGWFDAETDGNEIGKAGDPYTPTADITLYAQFSAQSSDNSLKTLKYGETPIEIVADQLVYNVNLPYKSVVPASVTYEANSLVATPAGEQTATVTDATATFTITAENGDAAEYTVNFTVAPKDAITIIKATHTGATTADVEGLIGGSVDKNTQAGGKLGSNDHYFGIKLAEGTFLAGDVLTIYASTTSTKVQIFSDKGTNMLNEGVFVDNKYTFTLEAATEWIYLYRTSTAGSAMNPVLGYMEVKRAMNPVLKALTVAGKTATINEAAKTISVKLDNGTDAATAVLVPTIVANGGEPTAALAATLAYNTPVNYILTDKDGDQTTYVLTATEAAAPAAEPVITVQPAGHDYEEGEVIAALTVEATVSDAGVLSYQWKKDGVDIAAATEASYTPAEAGSYTVVVTNTLGEETAEVTSEAAVITITHHYTFEAWVDEVDFTKAGEWTMFTCNSNGKIAQSTTKFAANQTIDEEGTTANAFTNKQFVVKFEKDVKAIEFHAYYNSSTLRTFNFIKVADSEDAAKAGTYTAIDVTDKVTRTLSDGARGKHYTFTIEGIRFEEGKYYFFELSNNMPIYDFFYTEQDYDEIRSGLTVGDFGTMCQATEILVVKGAIVYEIEKPNAIGLDLVEAEFPLVAGKPYIYQATAAEVNVVFGNEVATEVVPANGLVGRLSTATGVEYVPADMYVIQLNNLRKVAADNSIKFLADRAYINYDAVEENAVEDDPQAAPRRRVTMGGLSTDTATGMDEISAETGATKFIENGILYIRRGGKVYSAQGQLVK